MLLFRLNRGDAREDIDRLNCSGGRVLRERLDWMLFAAK